MLIIKLPDGESGKKCLGQGSSCTLYHTPLHVVGGRCKAILSTSCMLRCCTQPGRADPSRQSTCLTVISSSS
jgi:hypothetical protein